MRPLPKVLVVVCLCAGPVATATKQAQPRRICFVDEAIKQPSLVEFRKGLVQAVQARDLGRLRPMIAEDVFISTWT